MGQILNKDELACIVVYLSQDKVATVDINGASHEVWLKAPGETKPKPKIEIVAGTGFFVTNETGLYLVTAAHVAKEIRRNAMATLRGERDKPVTLPVGDLSPGSDDLQWLFHREADVAVLSLSPSRTVVETYLQGRFLPFSLLVPEKAAPPRDIPLTVIGFPLGLGATEYFSPLTLQTRASSGLLSLSRADTGQRTAFFVTENPAIGGYSGAPVFDVSIYQMGTMVTTGGGTKCYGLMHGTISDNTGGKLAAVVPSFFIIETINQVNA